MKEVLVEAVVKNKTTIEDERKLHYLVILEINAKLEIGLSKSYPIEECSSNKTGPGNLALF